MFQRSKETRSHSDMFQQYSATSPCSPGNANVQHRLFENLSQETAYCSITHSDFCVTNLNQLIFSTGSRKYIPSNESGILAFNAKMHRKNWRFICRVLTWGDDPTNMLQRSGPNISCFNRLPFLPRWAAQLPPLSRYIFFLSHPPPYQYRCHILQGDSCLWPLFHAGLFTLVLRYSAHFSQFGSVITTVLPAGCQ